MTSIVKQNCYWAVFLYIAELYITNFQEKNSYWNEFVCSPILTVLECVLHIAEFLQPKHIVRCCLTVIIHAGMTSVSLQCLNFCSHPIIVIQFLTVYVLLKHPKSLKEVLFLLDHSSYLIKNQVVDKVNI